MHCVHPRTSLGVLELELMVDKEAYVRGITEGVEHHLCSSDSHPAYRGIHALWCPTVANCQFIAFLPPIASLFHEP